MRRPLTPRERRGGALLLLAALLAGLYWLLLHSWFVGPLLEQQGQMDTLREQHRQYAGLLQQTAPLQQRLEQAREAASSNASLLEGEDSSAVAADLMQAVSDRIKANQAYGAGCSLARRMPIVPEPSSDSPYRQVKLSLDLECAIEPLQRLLFELEYGRPLLFVDELNLRRANTAGLEGGPGRLEVHLLVSGYLHRAPAAEEPQPDEPQP
jgi:general secretion pathway protein M